MSFLEIGQNLNSAQDEHAVEAGEYDVRITVADIPEGKSYMLVRFEIIGDPYAKELSTFFNLPGSGRTPKEENRNALKLRYFAEAFSIDFSRRIEVSAQYPDGLVGAEGTVVLSEPTDDGKGYGPQNSIKRFVPRR